MIVKILGAIDLTAAAAFLMLIFGIQPFTQLLLFSAGLLLLKSMFLITGDVLSFVDLLAAVILILSLFLSLPPILLWVPAFLLVAKGVASFI
ncbi:MAG TPA: hypothetical protein VJK51_01305 [Candidatus Nanoarchaeia archaeon]|nr:hypothetical protein [Candidatus Nanoarchaeia archaeon]